MNIYLSKKEKKEHLKPTYLSNYLNKMNCKRKQLENEINIEQK